MPQEEQAKIDELILKRQAAVRRLTCLQDEAKRMADDLENAQSLLQDAAQGKKPDFVELHGYPDKEDIEQSLSSIVREVTIAQELREKLPLGFVKPLLKRAAAQDGHIRRAEFA